MMNGRRAVFLDRDGVLNDALVRDGQPYAPRSLQEVNITADAQATLPRLREQGYLLICVTNQPDVGRGKLSHDTAEAINGKVRSALPLDDLLVSYDTDDAAPFRKPNPGMLVAAAEKYGIDLAGSVMIGDRWKDIEAGRRAGCRTIHLDRHYKEGWPVRPAHFTVRSLQEAAERILGSAQEEPWRRIVNRLKVRIFADGADLASMLRMVAQPFVAGFTTNPTLMKQAGVASYEKFARELLAAIPCHPISFEVVTDEFDDMKKQAAKIASWGDNVYVKIPITNTRKESSLPLVRDLARDGIKVNVTALFTLDQVRKTAQALEGGPPACVSVFAGRLADTGVDPLPLMQASLKELAPFGNQELIWASPREVFNIIQADSIGCDIITATHDLLKKVPLFGKDHTEYSLETVKMFYNDGTQAGIVP